MEMLVSIIILCSIMGISLPVLHRARNKALIVRTKSIISTIEAALCMYETDFGDYPKSDDENNSKVLVEKLQGPIDSDRWNGPYLRLKKEDLDKDGNILDAWKVPIKYKYPQTEKNNVPFLLFSAGPDRKFETEDDIGNW